MTNENVIEFYLEQKCYEYVIVKDKKENELRRLIAFNYNSDGEVEEMYILHEIGGRVYDEDWRLLCDENLNIYEH